MSNVKAAIITSIITSLLISFTIIYAITNKTAPIEEDLDSNIDLSRSALNNR